MKIYERSDGDVVLDFGPPNGPFITLKPEFWRALVRAIKAGQTP